MESLRGIQTEVEQFVVGVFRGLWWLLGWCFDNWLLCLIVIAAVVITFAVYDEAERYRRQKPTFDETYERLSRRGVCDTPGGAEYNRVLREWRLADMPPIRNFICERANVEPKPKPPWWKPTW